MVVFLATQPYLLTYRHLNKLNMYFLHENDLYEHDLSFLHVAEFLLQMFYNSIYVYFQIPKLDQQLYKLTPCPISFIYLIKNDKWRLTPLIKCLFHSRFTYKISTMMSALKIVVTIE